MRTWRNADIAPPVVCGTYMHQPTASQCWLGTHPSQLHHCITVLARDTPSRASLDLSHHTTASQCWLGTHPSHAAIQSRPDYTTASQCWLRTHPSHAAIQSRPNYTTASQCWLGTHPSHTALHTQSRPSTRKQKNLICTMLPKAQWWVANIKQVLFMAWMLRIKVHFCDWPFLFIYKTLTIWTLLVGKLKLVLQLYNSLEESALPWWLKL